MAEDVAGNVWAGASDGLLVRVTDDAGRVGLGEASVTSVWSGETQAGTIALIHEVLAPLAQLCHRETVQIEAKQSPDGGHGGDFHRG